MKPPPCAGGWIVQPVNARATLLWSWLRGPRRAHNDAHSGSAERANTRECGSRVFRVQRRTIAVGHAARVIEIEEHRRTLRYRFEQVAEFAESVRTDDVLVEVDEIVWLG